MIEFKTSPVPVQVGHWHFETAKWEDGVCIKQRVKELRFDKPDRDYQGLLHGFSTEGSDGELTAVAIVEKQDGTFDTPSVTIIKLLPLSGTA